MFLIMFCTLCIRDGITGWKLTDFTYQLLMKPLFLGMMYLQAHGEIPDNSVGQMQGGVGQ